MSKELYSLLGVSKTATDAEIKSAFRKLARKYHPDVNKDNPDAEKKFKEINGAYDVLGDKEKRKKYDNHEIDSDGKPTGYGAGYGSGFGGGQGNPFGQGFGGGGQYGENAGGFDFSSIFGEDVFSNFSGGGFQGFGGNSRRRAQKGQDISYNMKISFLDAANGDEKTVQIGGKNINVKIPSGTIDGQTLRLKGLGQDGMNGGTRGDVLITINVESHPHFSLEGNNVLLELPISLKEAVLGGKITIPTISGKVAINVPSYASSGEKLRLKGKGIKTKSSCGDQIVVLKIILPKTKDEALEKVLEKTPDEDVRNF